ncbi:hypothetical protein V492_07461 [Pseudogymnoascus sp. VKM F-4246]|nr:hypothetical protein V492_07461 [Pseudogymnoascus sp. VKM F-4246]
MAGKKRTTAASPPPNSGFKASASFIMARGNTSPKTVNAKPAAMNEEPHTGFVPVYIHTAKCDICEKRNDSVLQRCTTCTSQFCYRCMLGGDGIHVKSNDMDWADYGAQATSTSKAQKKAQEPVVKHERGSPLKERSTFATDIPSCRYHHKEFKVEHLNTKGPYLAYGTPAKTGPAPKNQKTAAVQQTNPWRPAPAAKKDSESANARRNPTQAQFPLVIPTDEEDYEPRLYRFLKKSRDSDMIDNDMTEEESDSSDDEDPRRLTDFFPNPYGVPTRKRIFGKSATNPWAQEVKEHRKDIKEEIALIDRRLDLLNDKKRLALVRKMQFDEALDAACILMSMKSDARGCPSEAELSIQTRELRNDGALGVTFPVSNMRTGSSGTPAVSKGTPANTRPIFKDSLARIFETDNAVAGPVSKGVQADAGSFAADKRYTLTEADKLAMEKERKVDAVVEAAYYSLMREGQSRK